MPTVKMSSVVVDRLQMEKKSRYQHEFIFILASMILGFYVLFGSIRIGFGTLEEPEAGVFPFLAGLLIIIPTILTVILKQKPIKQELLFKNRRGIKIFSLMALIFFLWIIVMPCLGYVIVTLLAALCFSKILGLEGWLKPLILSIGIGFFIYLLFDYWLYIDLPRGILG